MIGIKNKAAFTLMEVIVAVSLFAIIVLSSTEIFRLVINGQREAIASQNVQESLKYFFEVTAKEVRMARKSDGSCGVVSGDVYNLTSNSLGDVVKFKNFYGQCVVYELETVGNVNRFKISRGSDSAYISPAKINMQELKMQVDTSGQETLTLYLLAYAASEKKEASQMEIQTSISSRYYR